MAKRLNQNLVQESERRAIGDAARTPLNMSNPPHPGTALYLILTHVSFVVRRVINTLPTLQQLDSLLQPSPLPFLLLPFLSFPFPPSNPSNPAIFFFALLSFAISFFISFLPIFVLLLSSSPLRN